MCSVHCDCTFLVLATVHCDMQLQGCKQASDSQVQFNFTQTWIINIDKDPFSLTQSNDKLLLFKYFCTKHRLFEQFICLTDNWPASDLQFLNQQIIESFDCTFSDITSCREMCFDLLCTVNKVHINCALNILENIIAIGNWSIDKRKLIQILTKIFFHDDEISGYNFYCNLMHLLQQDSNMSNVYHLIIKTLCRLSTNITENDLNMMPWCNKHSKTFWWYISINL